jgi:hypothetical protein
MKPSQFVVEKYLEVLRYLKSRFPMYHLSNFFFRDVQYGIMAMLEERGVSVNYVEAEQSARALIERLEREKIFSPIDHQTWVVRYPDFRKEAVRPAVPARPGAVTPAQSKPVQGPAAQGSVSARVGATEIREQ